MSVSSSTYLTPHIKRIYMIENILTVSNTNRTDPVLSWAFEPWRSTQYRTNDRSNRLHARNQHLENNHRCSVACSNGWSVEVSDGFSLFHRYLPKDRHLPSGCLRESMYLQSRFPTARHFCDFWCIRFVPDQNTKPCRNRVDNLLELPIDISIQSLFTKAASLYSHEQHNLSHQ